ncbi:hypothetical protein NPS01_10860 [Nocardioides psychrotolerans]|uniref:Lipoprotein n=1 Tax=Nocardioides psychrotolerans TaxID=1005945 RepID=A0A1I3ECQ1_9ACTN|nr:hypothetical protein [Nocardioides psychrotolerans]GEP37423.1 hypothetical protein NPS01_10860 [Nocardioides psychrotolerans]SFH96736.1 hypothetical protein SAMN05216561_103305 [Nocardioides psychrotolerans]
MRKKIFAAVAVLALGLGLGGWQAQASQPTAVHASAAALPLQAVLPYEGHYLGHDMYYRTVRFDYYGGRIHNFRVNGTGFGGASVSGHQWHHTCNDGKCTRGGWTDDVTVEGVWNMPSSGAEAHFTAALFAHRSSTPSKVSLTKAGVSRTSTVHAVLPYEGSYLGHDMYGRMVHFTFKGNQMSGFMVNHTSFGGAHVGGSAWHETCSGGRCTTGRWTDDVTVEGTWRDPNGHQSHWTARLFAH